MGIRKQHGVGHKSERHQHEMHNTCGSGKEAAYHLRCNNAAGSMTRLKSRRNGWSLPPHGLQVAAWLVTLWVALVAFGAIVPNFSHREFRIIFNVITALFVLVMIVLNLIVTTLDPADLNVKLKVRRSPRPLFDRDRHVHVIDENYFCNICEAFINSSSKHCRQCNKCVADFDHHCKWLNNCVGRRNYYWFIAYVVATVLGAMWILTLSVIQPILWALKHHQVASTFYVFGSNVPEYGWLTIILITAVLMLLVCALTTHLLAFHIRLISNGMTTYGYIMEEKQKEEERQHSRMDNDNSRKRQWLCLNNCIKDQEGDAVVIDSTSTSISLSASVNTGAMRQTALGVPDNVEPLRKTNVWTTATHVNLDVPTNIDKTPPVNHNRQMLSGSRLSLGTRVNRTFSKFIANASSSYARITTRDGEPNKLSQQTDADGEDATDVKSTNQLIKLSTVPKLPSIKTEPNYAQNRDSTYLAHIVGGTRKTTLPGIFMSSPSRQDDSSISEIPLADFRGKHSRKADSLFLSRSSQLNAMCIASGRFAVVRCEQPQPDWTSLQDETGVGVQHSAKLFRSDHLVSRTFLDRPEPHRNSLG